MRTKGKVVLITGAGGGMGEAHAWALAKEGAVMMLADIRPEAVSSVAEAINREFGDNTAVAMGLDVADYESWKSVVNATVEQFGALDALVNNAGIGATGSVEDAVVEEWDRAIQVNLNGTFYGMKAVVPELKKQQTSSIINISSIAGLVGFKNRAAYSASKWGVHGLTKTSALDLGHYGIRVNSIHPGSVNTPMTAHLKRGFGQVPLGRAAEPNEVSALVIYLVSDESAYVSGAAIPIDGGETSGNNLRAFN